MFKSLYLNPYQLKNYDKMSFVKTFFKKYRFYQKKLMVYFNYVLSVSKFFRRFFRRSYVSFVQLKNGYQKNRLTKNETKIFSLFKIVVQDNRSLLQKSAHLFKIDVNGNEYILDKASHLISIKHNEYSSTIRISEFLSHKLAVIFDSEMESRMKEQMDKREDAQGKMLSKIIQELTNKNLKK